MSDSDTSVEPSTPTMQPTIAPEPNAPARPRRLSRSNAMGPVELARQLNYTDSDSDDDMDCSDDAPIMPPTS